MRRRALSATNVAPDWLRRLVGGDSQLPWLRHISLIELDAARVDSKMWESVHAMRFLREVTFCGQLDEPNARQLERISSLRRLSFRPDQSAAAPYRVSKMADVGSLRTVAWIRQLEEIELNDVNISEQSLGELLVLPRLRKLVINCNFSPSQLERYENFSAAHPEIKVEINWGSGRPKPRYQ
jgi:hypothetical protein